LSESQGDTFQIGLALAGAISAGAYTAGVLDFLFQALDEWEKQRQQPGVPNHRVALKVMAGASAGAITGALGAVALARGFQPKEFSRGEIQASYRTPDMPYQTARCVLPSLYETWVTRPRLVAENGGVDFLSVEDLDKSKGQQPAAVLSLLNAKLLDEIKREALLPSAAAPAAKTNPGYPYVADPLHVYVTLSNLRGIPFQVGFGNSTYGMQTHGDRVHYTITGLGKTRLGNGNGGSNRWLEKDSFTPLTVAALCEGAARQELPPEWDQYGTCALASSAFPIGLASRQIVASIKHYTRRSYPIPLPNGIEIKPSFPPGWQGVNGDFIFLNVDGGLINNNPFDYAQYALMGNCAAPKLDGHTADCAVIMIAPFPEPPAFLADGKPAAGLVDIIRALFPTLINQARFRASELGSALDTTDFGRFLIAPRRKLPDRSTEERYTIACGVLGGFGGFLEEGFRAHDFQLGRRNCQAFLRGTFGLPATNPIGGAMRDQAQFHILANPENRHPEDEYTIIPLFGSAADEVPLPHWPRMGQPELDEVIRRVALRLEAVAPLLIEAQTASPVLRKLGKIGLRVGRSRLLEYIRLAILSDLVRRDQIAGWELPHALLQWVNGDQAGREDKPKTADDVRAVLAELASPAFTFRTVNGISSAIHLNADFVNGVLARLCQAEDDKPFAVRRVGGGKRDEPLFTLAARMPKGPWSWPVLNKLNNWLDPPATDQNSAGRQFAS
jgi:hypothetical protein